MGLSNTATEAYFRCDKWNTSCVNDICSTTCTSNQNKITNGNFCADTAFYDKDMIGSSISTIRRSDAEISLAVNLNNITTDEGVSVTEYIENVVKRELDEKLNPQPSFKVVQPRKSEDIDISELMMLI